jgi:hypothetical protein
MLDSGVSPDDLASICDAIERERDILSDDVVEATSRAIGYQTDRAGSIVADIVSESTLDDHIKSLKRLATRAGIASERVGRATKAIEHRIGEIQELDVDANKPSFSGRTRHESDKFDDKAIRDLFSPLAS